MKLKDFISKWGTLIFLISFIAGIASCTIVSISVADGADPLWFILPAILGGYALCSFIYLIVDMLVVKSIQKLINKSDEEIK